MNKQSELVVSNNLVEYIEAAIFAAIAFVIAFVPLDIGPMEAELGMIPIIILSYRRGLKTGLLSGFVWGLIKLASGNITMLSVLQVLVEYVFAFAVSGLAGVASNKLKDEITSDKWKRAFITIAQSVFLAVFVKYGIHFIAGVIYWGMYAPEGMSPYIYSFIVNGASGIASFLVVGSIVAFIVYKAPQLLSTDN